MLNLQLPPPPPPPSTKPKGKVKILNVVPVVILIVCVVGALYFSGFLSDFGLSPDTDTTPKPSNTIAPNDNRVLATAPPLTPARDIEGTWVTTFQTEFKIATDFQTTGVLEDVGSEQRAMTWTITPLQDENTVLVTVQFSSSKLTLISDSGYTPDVSFMQLTGIINGTQLTLIQGDQGPIEQYGSVGEFTFTSTQMQGTWHDHWEGVYEQNVYTATNGLKLMKQ
jgi:hypothetical protein